MTDRPKRSIARVLEPFSVPELLLACSAVAYAVSFVLMLSFWHPGRGVGATLYLAIVLAAMATGPLAGAAAGALASVVYWSVLILGFDRPFSIVLSSAGVIHLLNFVFVGAVVGYFARRMRHMLRDSLGVLDDLLVLAGRDVVTGSGNAVGFEADAAERLRERKPFVLLLASPPDGLGAEENDLRSIAAALREELEPGDELARVGAAEFVMLVSCPHARAAEALATHFERELDAAGLRLSFGWAAPPEDGASVLELYAAAAARLYARRAVRDEWHPTAATALLVEDLESRRHAATAVAGTQRAATNS
jgi:hypothetical protein